MLRAAYGLLRDSGRVFLEAAPNDLDPDEIGRTLVAQPCVAEVHDLHVWEISSGFPALTAHVLVVARLRLPRDAATARRACSRSSFGIGAHDAPGRPRAAACRRFRSRRGRAGAGLAALLPDRRGREHEIRERYPEEQRRRRSRATSAPVRQLGRHRWLTPECSEKRHGHQRDGAKSVLRGRCREYAEKDHRDDCEERDLDPDPPC